MTVQLSICCLLLSYMKNETVKQVIRGKLEQHPYICMYVRMTSRTYPRVGEAYVENVLMNGANV